jgi:hypothetical protein
METQLVVRDKDMKNIVWRSYQYVAMYNVNNKFALTQGGWNTVKADTQLKDYTLTDIARPNNDTLYIGCMLDLRVEPIILDIPAFDSKSCNSYSTILPSIRLMSSTGRF